MTRRRQLVEMLTAEKNRKSQMRQSIDAHLESLEEQIRHEQSE